MSGKPDARRAACPESALPGLGEVAMGTGERRERERQARRRSILDCTRALIAEQGVERVSMEDIAGRTELSKATLYLYFPSKEAILNEICEESARGFVEYLGQMSAGGGGLTGMAAIRFLWNGYMRIFGESDEIIVVFRIRNYLANWLPADPRQTEIKSPYIDSILAAMRAMLEQCKAEGLFDPALNCDDAVRLLLATFSNIVRNSARLPPDAGSPPEMIREMTDTFRLVIRGFAREGVEHSLVDIGI